MIFNKKRAFFEEKLTDAREKFKYLWKKLKSIGLLSKNSSKEVSALRVNNTALSEFPLKMLPKALNKFFVSSVVKYYEHMIQGDHFNLTFVSENSNLSNFKVTEDSKVAGLLRISGRLLRYGAKFLAQSISHLRHLSITSGKLPDNYKVAKLKVLYKKGFLT